MSDHNEVNGSLLSREQRRKIKARKIKVLIVDDQLSSCQFLKVILDSEPDLEIVGTAKDGEEALKQVEMLHPDIVLMDFEMPKQDGITTTETICQRFPEIKVIIISSHQRQEYINRALRAGAKGFLLKNTLSKELTNDIRLVDQDYIEFGPGLFRQVEAEIIDIPANNEEGLNGQNHLPTSTAPVLSTTKIPSTQINRDDWAQGTKELLDILPRVWTRGLLYFLAVFTVIALPWAMFSQVEETGTARGQLEPQGKTVKLDAPVTGTIAQIQVKEGEAVTVGQSLLVLESELVKWEVQQARSKLEGESNRLNQLELLQDQLLVALATQRQQNQAQELEKQAQVHQAQQNLDSLKNSYNLQKEEKLAQVRQAQQNIEYSQTAHKLAAIRLQNSQREVQRYREALEGGIVSAIQVAEREDIAQEKQRVNDQTQSDLEQAKLRLVEQRSSYERTIRQAKGEIEQAQLQLKEQQSSYQSLIGSGELAVLKSMEQLKNLETQITTLKAEIAQSESQIDSLEFQLNQRVLEAPIEGTVFRLPIQGSGEVVQPGDMIAEIAPKGTSLLLRAQMGTTDSGFLAKGMPVKMKFDAYPFQDYGVVEGELAKISPTTEEVETPEGKATAYNLEIKLHQTCIPTPNECITLRPGDTATAEVIVRQRRIMDFILDPFRKLQKGGLEL
ncbi:MAG: response regulator [Xenococcus sp. MO_188.B8]|nr:response regulator [Xenococcus sp. MO_188.B8]